MANAITENFEQLTYRDLAARLGVSPDAARMKAKRRTKAGTWRIIPGNHPNDPVLVEVPLTDLIAAPEHDAGEQHERSGGERQGKHKLRTSGNERTNVLLELALANLTDSQNHVRQLTSQLVEAKEAHRRDATELAAAVMREIATGAELERALLAVAELQERLSQAQKPWWRRMF